MNILLSLHETPFERSADALVTTLAEEDVKVVDGSHFRGLDDNYVRISVRDRETNRAFMDSLERVLKRNL